MAKLDDLKTSLADLQSAVKAQSENVQSEIDKAVEAYKTKDQAEDDSTFDAAISQIRSLTSSLSTQVGAVSQTASSLTPADLSTTAGAAGTDPAAPTGPTAPEVQTSQTATTDPTGTAAASAAIANVPDGAMSTAAPGAKTDPVTGADVAQVGSAEAPTDANTATGGTDLAASNPSTSEDTESTKESRKRNPSTSSTVPTGDK